MSIASDAEWDRLERERYEQKIEGMRKLIATEKGEEYAYSLPEAVLALTLIVMGGATDYTDPREHCLEEE